MKTSDNNFQLDPESSWKKVEPQLEQHFRVKRRIRLLWFFFAGALLVGSLWWGYTNNQASVATSQKAVVEVDSKTSLETPSENVKANFNSTTSTSSNLGNPVNVDRSVQENAISNPTNSSSVEDNNRLPSVNSSKNKKRTTPSSSAAVVSTNSNQFKNEPTAATNVPAAANESKSDATIAAAKNQADNNSVSQSSTINDVKSELAVTEKAAAEEKHLEVVQTVKAAEEISKVPAVPTDTTLVSLVKDSLQNQILPLLPVETRKWFAGVYGVAYQTSKTLSAPYPDWVNRRKAEELRSVGYGAGLEVLTTSKTNWTFGFGLEYAQYGEKTNYSAYSYRPVTEDSLLWSYLYDNTDTLYVSGNQVFLRDLTPNIIDSVSTVVTDTVIRFTSDASVAAKNGRAQWTYIELPVSIGYTLKKGKWGFGINGAIVPAMLSQTGGYYLLPDETGSTTLSEISSTNRFMVSVRLGLGVEYALTNRWYLHLDPQWRRQLVAVYSGNSIDQRYSAVGAMMGVRMRLP